MWSAKLNANSTNTYIHKSKISFSKEAQKNTIFPLFILSSSQKFSSSFRSKKKKTVRAASFAFVLHRFFFFLVFFFTPLCYNLSLCLQLPICHIKKNNFSLPTVCRDFLRRPSDFRLWWVCVYIFLIIFRVNFCII